jgi:hypothetical protein
MVMPGDSAPAAREQSFAPKRKNQVAAQYLSRSRHPTAVALRAEALINRYPNLSEVELAELINLMPRLPILDFGLMTAVDRIAPKMEAFHRDHGDKLGPSLASAVTFLAIPSIIVLGVIVWALG